MHNEYFHAANENILYDYFHANEYILWALRISYDLLH
jgi:hypothetical protein